MCEKCGCAECAGCEKKPEQAEEKKPEQAEEKKKKYYAKKPVKA